MAGLNKTTADLLFNLAIFGGIAVGGWYAYNNNMFGIRNILGGIVPAAVTAGLPAPPVQTTPSITQMQQTGTIPNLSGFETGYSPGAGPIPGGAPGINYSSSIYESPYCTPSIDPVTGIDYSLYYPPTGTGTLTGTNPTPYPNPCLPGYYRASDLKCYPIPTQFPGSGCGEGMYLANDGRCYPYPAGTSTGGYGTGTGYGGGYAPTPCPLGEYRASDGRCYALPTPPPESCPAGAYRASDGRCYPIQPGQTVGDCPAGYSMGSDGVCRATTQCPAGYTMSGGVCVRNPLTCPTGYTEQNGVCVQNITQQCPTGYVYQNGNCVYQGPSSCPAGYVLQGNICVQQQPQCPAGYMPSGTGQCIYIGQQQTCPAGCISINTGGTSTCYCGGQQQQQYPSLSPLNINITSRTLIKELPPGVSPSQFSEQILKNDPYKVDVTMWTAAMARPELTGGVPIFAVIIKATDSSEVQDAISRVGFRPLSSEDLMRYGQPSGGGYYASAFPGFRKPSRRFNRRILNKYR